MLWKESWRTDPIAKQIADRHYNRQNPNSPNFVPPGRCLVLLSVNHDAFWVTSYPFKEYVLHAWGGAFVCSAFRNEGPTLSSDLIRSACSATAATWDIPPLGMITFIDTKKVRKKRDWGRCYRKAGFRDAICPIHSGESPDCAACASRTKSGLVALQLLPDDFPDPHLPLFRLKQENIK